MAEDPDPLIIRILDLAELVPEHALDAVVLGEALVQEAVVRVEEPQGTQVVLDDVREEHLRFLHHRLRKLLGEDRAVILHEGRVSLDRRYFWLDTWAFEQLAADLEAASDGELDRIGERLLALYRGSFMADDADAAWLIPARERLRGRFSRVLARVCRHLEERGEAARARALHEKSLEIDPLAEFKATVSDR